MRYLIYVEFAASLALIANPAAGQRTTSPEPQAFVTDSSARFFFPLDKRASYIWNSPLKGAYPAMPEFSWDVLWYGTSLVPGKDPMGLSLVVRWESGRPHKGTLSDLIRGHTVDVLIECMTCDGAAFVHPQRDGDSVFATVERGRLVFNVRGREAVHRIFPVLPDTVTFITGPTNVGSTQGVVVNCTPSLARQHPRSCVVQPPKQPPNADSAAAENAPRRVYVPVIRFQNATLQKHVRVRVKTLYGKVWKVLSTGSLGGVMLTQAPLGPVLLEALCPRQKSAPTKISGTVYVLIAPRADSAAQLWSDPSVCTR